MSLVSVHWEYGISHQITFWYKKTCVTKETLAHENRAPINIDVLILFRLSVDSIFNYGGK